MGVHHVGSLSLGQWAAIVRHWNRANGGAQVDAPSADEFDRAVLAARGVE